MIFLVLFFFWLWYILKVIRSEDRWIPLSQAEMSIIISHRFQYPPIFHLVTRFDKMLLRNAVFANIKDWMTNKMKFFYLFWNRLDCWRVSVSSITHPLKLVYLHNHNHNNFVPLWCSEKRKTYIITLTRLKYAVIALWWC